MKNTKTSSVVVYKIISAFDNLSAKVTSKITCMRNKARGRKELAHLDDRLLRDIGLNRYDVQNELNKPCKYTQ